MSSSIPESFGLVPINAKWDIVRGDTAELLVEFLQNDEVTAFNTTSWSYAASTYDFKGDIIDELQVVEVATGVKIIAPAEITQFWGTGYGSVSAELAFDLQVTYDVTKVWTPIVGTIKVIADVTGGNL